jgi:hypothetical protein
MKRKIIIAFILGIMLLTGSNSAQAVKNYFKNIKISPGNSEYFKEREKIKNFLDNLISYYQSRSLSGFVRLVSDDYTLDRDILEDSVRNDFSKYSFIRIDYVLNNYVKDTKNNRYFVSLNYSRMREERATSKIISDFGTTEFVLQEYKGILRLYSMKKPYLFGVN